MDTRKLRAGPTGYLPSQTAGQTGQTEQRKKEGSGGAKWLCAWSDALAGVQTSSRCMALGDVSGSGEMSLIAGDYAKVLKVFSGKSLSGEIKLLHPPTAVVPLYIDGKGSVRGARPAAAVAVAAGDAVFVYRNMHPYYKFSLPPGPVPPRESELWQLMTASPQEMSFMDGAAALTELAATVGPDAMSFRSLDLMRLSDAASMAAYTNGTTNIPLSRPGVITAMAPLARRFDEPEDMSLLVVASESRHVYVLDASARGLEVAMSCKVPGVPAHVAVSGQYSVGYRIALACRNGRVYFVKGGEVQGLPIELDTYAMGLVMVDAKSLVVGLASNRAVCYHTKGKKRYSIAFDSELTAMTRVFLKMRNQVAVAFGLASGVVKIYAGRTCVSVIATDSPPRGLVFGAYHREERSLVIATESGALHLHMLPRSQVTAMSSQAGAVVPLEEQAAPLQLPKRTQLWLDQSARERTAGLAMHTAYQKALFHIKLRTLREFVRLQQSAAGSSTTVAMAPASSSASHVAAPTSLNAKLVAQVVGLGPQFRLKTTVTNASSAAVVGLALSVQYDSTSYAFRQSLLSLPLLVPGLPYVNSTPFHCVTDGASGTLTVSLIKLGSDVPLISYKLRVPIPELMLEV